MLLRKAASHRSRWRVFTVHVDVTKPTGRTTAQTNTGNGVYGIFYAMRGL